MEHYGFKIGDLVRYHKDSFVGVILDISEDQITIRWFHQDENSYYLNGLWVSTRLLRIA